MFWSSSGVPFNHKKVIKTADKFYILWMHYQKWIIWMLYKWMNILLQWKKQAK